MGRKKKKKEREKRGRAISQEQWYSPVIAVLGRLRQVSNLRSVLAMVDLVKQHSKTKQTNEKGCLWLMKKLPLSP